MRGDQQSSSFFRLAALASLGESYIKNNDLCILKGGGEIFYGKPRFRCQKQPLKISTPNLVLHLLWHVLAPENWFLGYISINMRRVKGPLLARVPSLARFFDNPTKITCVRDRVVKSFFAEAVNTVA